MNKQLYLTPLCKTFSVKVQGFMCQQSPLFGTSGAAGAGLDIDNPSNDYGSF